MGKLVVPRESYSMLDHRRGAVLKRMARVGPFIVATATYVKVQCGNLGCKCAKSKKDRHEKLHLSWTDSKGDGICYVPVKLRKEVLEWIENHRTLKDYMMEMTILSRRMIKMYVRTRGRANKKFPKK